MSHLEAPGRDEIRRLLASRNIFVLSQMPRTNKRMYLSYYDKVRAYVSFITPEAQGLDPGVAANG